MSKGLRASFKILLTMPLVYIMLIMAFLCEEKPEFDFNISSISILTIVYTNVRNKFKVHSNLL